MQSALREQIVALLRGGNAHMSFDEAIADFPMERINEVPAHGLYSAWHVLEHMRRTQRDILNFITDPKYQEGTWPDDYWPAKDAQVEAAGWQTTVDAFRTDHAALVALAEESTTDYIAPIPWGSGQNVLRELLLVADHNAYHIGELGSMRQLMQAWSQNHPKG